MFEFVSVAGLIASAAVILMELRTYKFNRDIKVLNSVLYEVIDDHHKLCEKHDAFVDFTFKKLGINDGSAKDSTESQSANNA